jgi:hypothetical protein
VVLQEFLEARAALEHVGVGGTSWEHREGLPAWLTGSQAWVAHAWVGGPALQHKQKVDRRTLGWVVLGMVLSSTFQGNTVALLQIVPVLPN